MYPKMMLESLQDPYSRKQDGFRKIFFFQTRILSGKYFFSKVGFFQENIFFSKVGFFKKLLNILGEKIEFCIPKKDSNDSGVILIHWGPYSSKIKISRIIQGKCSRMDSNQLYESACIILLILIDWGPYSPKITIVP